MFIVDKIKLNGDFEQLWLSGEVVKVNLKENYIIIKPEFPEDAEQVKVFLTPETKMERIKIIEQTINDFKPGDFISLESKQDVRGKAVIEEIEMIQIVPSFLLAPEM